MKFIYCLSKLASIGAVAVTLSLYGGANCCDSASDISCLSTSAEPRMISYSWMSLARWYRMHSEDVDIAEQGEAPIVFIGDSITECWESAGKNVWEKHFEPLGVVNLGIGGDMTQNLLWRMDHGAIGNLNPEKVVCMIGTNNFGFTKESPEQVAKGVIAVVEQLKKSFVDAEILVFAVFPREELPENPYRSKIKQLNSMIQQVETCDRVTFLDIEDRLLDKNGRLSADIMPDFLHPNETGYKIWAKAILEWLNK